MTIQPRSEQETIITHDALTGKWHYYGDEPSLNRRYEKLISATRKQVESDGAISLLEGTITGGVPAINKRRSRRVLTDSQRKALADRLNANLGRRAD